MSCLRFSRERTTRWLTRLLLAMVALVFLLPFLKIDKIDLASSGAGQHHAASSGGDEQNSGGSSDYDYYFDAFLNQTRCVEMECAPGANCEARASWGVVMTLNTLTLSILLIYLLLASHLHFIPESAVVILLGCVLGGVLEAIDREFTDLFNFNPETFFLYLLPAIIFESGHSLNKDVFFQNIGSILTFAILGTVISTVIVGSGLIFLSHMGFMPSLGAMDSMAFAALISAVDPVATLAIFQALKVDSLLHYLVFGESVLNDVVSIALFKTFVEIKRYHETINAFVAMKILAQFLYVSITSISIGVIVSATGALLFKHFSFRAYPQLEMSLVFIFSYLPYLICEGLGLSGLFAIFFGGITNSHYMNYNLSPTTQLATKQIFQMMAFMSETLMFAYLGMAVFSFHHQFSASTVIATVALIFIGRAMNVFPLSALLNIFRAIRIEFNYQVIMWFSGLRGAVAFALALSFQGKNGPVIVTTTLTVVIFTILFMGIGTTPLLKLFKIPHGSSIHMIKSEVSGCCNDFEFHVESRIPFFLHGHFAHYSVSEISFVCPNIFKVREGKYCQHQSKHVGFLGVFPMFTPKF
eukprot:TRINITY_DN1808_c0_g1_i6.p1 TRINITY_DN1808_c0_g1~~TRINITY_DN1808_c0_g1_i6.p1  ORF type:complete len:583 (-),score=96.39 TRINITY_DN1808_c0_g1_i6:536-2284(-)